MRSLTPQLLSGMDMAVIEMVRFDASHADLKQLLILAEAASSCALEGMRVPAQDILLAGLDPAAAAPAPRAVAAAATAATLADRGHALISVQGLTELNAAVTGERSDPGEALDELSSFASRPDIPALVHAALSHAHLSAIRPFTEGNSRTGTALVMAMFRATGISAASLIPLSAGLAGNSRGYAWAMGEYSRGSCSPVIELFIESAFVTLDNCLAFAAEIRRAVELHQEMLGRTRSRAAGILAGELTRTPALNASTAMALCGSSESGAYRALDRLAEAGVLEPARKVGGVMTWTAPLITAALDAFLSRAASGHGAV